MTISPPGAEDRLIGAVIDGKYTVVQLLGKGGMGAVYQAKHNFMERNVALKLLNLKGVEANVDEFLRRFKREAQTASQIRHPSAVCIFDYGVTTIDNTAEAPYLVMELIEGVTLKNIIKQGKLHPKRVVPLMVQVCGALEEAHSIGIVHRDLKPDNIMVSQRNDGSERAHVLDFGIAKVVRSETEAEMTQTGSVLGTPRYMAPEQILSKPVDQRTDIYAMGIVLYEMLSGNVPFDSPSLMELAVRHVSEEPEPLLKRVPDAPISKSLERVIMRALSKEPERRQQSVQEFVHELLDAYPVEIEGGTPKSFQRRAQASKKLPVPQLAGGAAALILAGLGAFYFLGGGSEPESVATQKVTVPTPAAEQPLATVNKQPPVPSPAVDKVRQAFKEELLGLSKSTAPAPVKEVLKEIAVPVEESKGEPKVAPSPTTAPAAEQPTSEPRPVIAKKEAEPAPTQEKKPAVVKERKREPAPKVPTIDRQAEEEAARRLREAEERAAKAQERARVLEQRAKEAERRRQAVEAERQRQAEEARRRAESEARKPPPAAEEKEAPQTPPRKIRRRCGPSWCLD